MRSVRPGFWAGLATSLLFAIGVSVADRQESSTLAAPASVYIGHSGSSAELAGQSSDGGGFMPTVHEGGDKALLAGGACVYCATDGSGGVISLMPGARYWLSLADLSNSPALISESAACGSYDGVGTAIGANQTLVYVAPLFADGGAPWLSCCAQVATTSPHGPKLCATLAR